MLISLTYSGDSSEIALSMSDGRTRVVALPNWTHLGPDGKIADGKVEETILADKEVTFPHASPVTTTKWCPGRKNQVESHNWTHVPDKKMVYDERKQKQDSGQRCVL